MPKKNDIVPMQQKRGPRGPSKPITDQMFDQIVSMIRIHCTQNEICNIIGMSATTLNRRLTERVYDNFEVLYKKHNDEGKASIRRMQWQAAEKGNSAMLVWLGKQYLSQTDKVDARIGGPDGGPLITKIEHEYIDVTP